MSGVRIANNVVGEDLKEENSIRRQVGLIIKTLLPDVLDLQKEYLYANCYLLCWPLKKCEELIPRRAKNLPFAHAAAPCGTKNVRARAGDKLLTLF